MSLLQNFSQKQEELTRITDQLLQGQAKLQTTPACISTQLAGVETLAKAALNAIVAHTLSCIEAFTTYLTVIESSIHALLPTTSIRNNRNPPTITPASDGSTD